MYSAERLEAAKAARTPYYWQALYQQNPQAEGGAEWPSEYFGPDIWFDEWPREWCIKTVALDPSKGTDSKFGDYSAFALMMLGHDGVLYVDADLAIRNTAIIVETALEIQRTFRPDGFAVEVNQFQQLLADELNRLSQERNVLLPLYTDRQSGKEGGANPPLDSLAGSTPDTVQRRFARCAPAGRTAS